MEQKNNILKHLPSFEHQIKGKIVVDFPASKTQKPPVPEKEKMLSPTKAKHRNNLQTLKNLQSPTLRHSESQKVVTPGNKRARCSEGEQHLP
jgi:hypothetical protein